MIKVAMIIEEYGYFNCNFIKTLEKIFNDEKFTIETISSFNIKSGYLDQFQVVAYNTWTVSNVIEFLKETKKNPIVLIKQESGSIAKWCICSYDEGLNIKVI